MRFVIALLIGIVLTMTESANLFAQDTLIIRQIGELNVYANYVTLESDILFAYGAGDLYAVDISSPDDPEIIGENDDAAVHPFYGNNHIAFHEDYAYLAGLDGWSAIVDISDPEELETVGDFTGGHSVTVQDGYLFLAPGDDWDHLGPIIYDISEPDDPEPIDSLEINASVVIVDNDILYVLEDDRDYELFLFDVSDPEQPELLGSIDLDVNPGVRYDPPSSLDGLTISGDYAVVTANSLGLDNDWNVRLNYGQVSVIDISDPDSLDEVERLRLNRSVGDVKVYDEILYVSTSRGLECYDFSDPTDVSRIESNISPQFYGNFEVSNGIIYTAGNGWRHSLIIYSLQSSGPAISASPQTLDFDSLTVGSTAERTLTIESWGLDTLVVSDMATEGDQFSVDFEEEFNLPPDSARDFAVTFTPDSVGMFEGSLTISSNDTLMEEYVVELTGQGVRRDEDTLFFVKHIIADDFESALSVYAVDVDNDRDKDVIGAGGDVIAWWENNGEQEFSEHIIADDFEGASCVYAIDLDNDNDMDVLGAAVDADKITWWENDGEEEFEEHIIADDIDGARYVYATDFDDDGNVDILGAGWRNITWWKNNGDNDFTENTISDSRLGTSSVCTKDLDGDQDKDILVAYYFDEGNERIHGITWWENDGEGNFTGHSINDAFYEPASVYAEDVDGDGDIDIIGAGLGLGNVGDYDNLAWWENEGEGGFTEHRIPSLSDYISSIYAIDVDSDDDIDLLATDVSNYIDWYENDGDQEFTQHVITDSFAGSSSIFSLDLDIDGDADILGTGYDAGIAWWENIMDAESVLESDFSLHPSSFTLLPAYPNPFNATTRISYALPTSSEVKLGVYDLSGRIVSELVKGRKEAGYHHTTLNATNLPSGLYFVRFETVGHVFARKVMLIR